ncbi:MAG: radical SAM protein [Theionarchaea archaeon]|nr:radical SAM protein [Theionarchaea archaeon]
MNLEVSEIFLSLNGEGILMGVPTLFIRLSGCNLRCTWCDTTYAWNPGTVQSVDQIKKEVLEKDNGYCQWVLITGGEPLIQDVFPLVDALKPYYKIAIETNGSLYQEVLHYMDFISADIKPPSSGNPTTDMKILTRIIDAISKRGGQLKAVIADREDYTFICTLARDLDITVPLVLQPCWGSLTYDHLCSLYLESPLPVKSIRILTQLHKIGSIK